MLTIDEKQKIFETLDIKKRLELILKNIENENSILRCGKKNKRKS